MHRPRLRCWTLALALAALAASPSSSAAQEGPYVSQLKAQLRAYVVAEERFYAEHERYGTLGATEAESEIALTLAPGVRWVGQAEFGTRGHYLLLSHDEALELACAVYVGHVESRGRSPLASVLGEDAAEGAPGCKVFEAVRVCPSGHTYPGVLNWNFCPLHGHVLRDSVPHPEPVEWDRSHPEWDRAHLATIAVDGTTLEIAAFHNKRAPEGRRDDVNVHATRGDSIVSLSVAAQDVPTLLDALARHALTAVTIEDAVVPTSLTAHVSRDGIRFVFACEGETGCKPAGPLTLVVELSVADLRDVMRAFERGVLAFDAYGR